MGRARRKRSDRPHRASLLAAAAITLVLSAAPRAGAEHQSPRPALVERAILAQETRARDTAAKEWREARDSGVAWSYRATSRRIQGEREAGDAAAGRARDAAIARVEARGAATAGDLLELAALHEARARAAPRAQDRGAALSASIALYRRYLLDFPAHADRAHALDALARDLDDANDAASAIATRRALVCPGPPADPSDGYPADCHALTAPTALIAGAWRRLGDAHRTAAPVALDRAEAAYRRAIALDDVPARAASMLGLASVLTARDRPDASALQLVELLRFLDTQEKLPGDGPAYLRAPAFEAFAEALDHLAALPRVHRAAPASRTAVDLVEDPAIVPQNERWTPAIYEALGRRLEASGRHKQAIAAVERSLARWPTSDDAPFVDAHLAELYDRLAADAPEGSRERADALEHAYYARIKLPSYLGNGWGVSPRATTPEELNAIEHLVRGTLRRAASDRHNAGRALVDRALATSDEARRAGLLVRAGAEYRIAARTWEGYLAQDENAKDTAETRYWLADAAYRLVTIEIALGRDPSTEQVDHARKAAIVARDAGGEHRADAALLLVSLADRALDVEHRRFDRTAGTRGIERRTQVKTTGEGDEVKALTEPLPPTVVAAIAARDAYLAEVFPDDDRGHRRAELAYDAAALHFVYGDFAEARPRLSPLVDDCSNAEIGYRALERLITIANLAYDIPTSRDLAERAFVHCGRPAPLEEPCHDRIPAYVDAFEAFRKVSTMKDGPERTKQWRLVGTLYEYGLRAAPSRDEAPEAAMNGAYAYRQVGAYTQALELYRLFLDEYGRESILAELEKGNPHTTPPRPPDPKSYKEPLVFLLEGAESLGSAEIMAFDYRAAAATYTAIADNPRFNEEDRRSGAHNAFVLHKSLREPEATLAARAKFLRLAPPAAEKANDDYLASAFDLHSWDEHAPDEGPNRAARLGAVAALSRFHTANVGNSAANARVVEAAAQIARLLRAGGDARAKAWCGKAVAAFGRLRRAAKDKNDPLGSPEADLAAECAYRLADAAINADPALHRATAHAQRLDAILPDFNSHPWSVAALARKGALYEAFHQNEAAATLYL
ncbi:MAG: hypothetical protein ABJE95_08980, partial [Byssovorax sp.]